VDQVVEARDQLNEYDSARQQLLRIVAHHTVFIAERIDLVSKTLRKEQLLANLQSLWPVPERIKMNALCSPKALVKGTPALQSQDDYSLSAADLGLERRAKRQVKRPDIFYAQLQPKRVPRKDEPREESGSRALFLGHNMDQVGVEHSRQLYPSYEDYRPQNYGDSNAMNILAYHKTPGDAQTLYSQDYFCPLRGFREYVVGHQQPRTLQPKYAAIEHADAMLPGFSGGCTLNVQRRNKHTEPMNFNEMNLHARRGEPDTDQHIHLNAFGSLNNKTSHIEVSDSATIGHPYSSQVGDMSNNQATCQSLQNPLLSASIDLGPFITKLLARAASKPATTDQRWLQASTEATSNHAMGYPLQHPVLRFTPELGLQGNKLLPRGTGI